MTRNRQREGTQPLVLGVCSTLSAKSGLPVTLVRIGAILLLLRLGFMATLVSYLAVALFLPQKERG